MVAEEVRRLRAYGGPGPLSERYFGALEPRYEAMDSAGIRALARAFGASYAIVPKPTHLEFPRVYENAHFVIFQIPVYASSVSWVLGRIS